MSYLPLHERQAATRLLLDHIVQLQREYAAREDRMVSLAIGTGCTSLVKSVRGMGLALEAARKRIERVAPREQTK